MANVEFKRVELIERRLDALASRQTLNTAGERIGRYLTAQMKVNAVKQRIGTEGGGFGNTLNAINHQVRTLGGKTIVEAGVYGVFYARFHEYGTQNYKRTNPSRILYRILENYKTLGLLKGPGSGKGVFDIRTGRIKERPFIRPAVSDNMNTILQMLREEMNNASS
jgi:hypothetical protein